MLFRCYRGETETENRVNAEVRLFLWMFSVISGSPIWTSRATFFIWLKVWDWQHIMGFIKSHSSRYLWSAREISSCCHFYVNLLWMLFDWKTHNRDGYMCVSAVELHMLQDTSGCSVRLWCEENHILPLPRKNWGAGARLQKLKSDIAHLLDALLNVLTSAILQTCALVGLVFEMPFQPANKNYSG